ncbi:MAG TPA: hypothetical protein PK247_07625, partial [Candidatus Goldiibacteriota bacterium]|nr:hypothetical protein [Candidatus Goldiibacteriota bacterium]
MTKRLVTPALAREKLHGLIFLCLAAYSATCIISITLCEIFFVLALLLWAADAFAGGRKLSGEFNTYLTLPLAVFAVIHIIAAILGIDPANSIRDSRKLYLILMFFVAAKYLDSLEKIEKIVMFFAAGSLFIGAYAV